MLLEANICLRTWPALVNHKKVSVKFKSTLCRLAPILIHLFKSSSESFIHSCGKTFSSVEQNYNTFVLKKQRAKKLRDKKKTKKTYILKRYNHKLLVRNTGIHTDTLNT